jgi:undecaprenyl-phosphate 4-deoxy-4-formamido-L-arabinose transferase
VVIPIYNEDKVLAQLFGRLYPAMDRLGSPYEIVLVDDGSRDQSPEMIRAQVWARPDRTRAVLLAANVGQHLAIIAGFEHARGDRFVTLDADLQNPPEEIPKLLAAVDAGHDVAGGMRRRRKDSRFRLVASRLMNRLMQRITRVAVADYGCMLRAYRRDVVDAVLACEERNAYVPALANSFAARVAEIEGEHVERRAGRSKYRLGTLLNLYFDLLVSTTTAPLRLLSVVGTGCALAGVAFGALLLALRFAYGPTWAAQGVFTIFAVLFLFLGVQLLGMGLLGEYIGRISRDVQHRPRFIVREIVGTGWSGPRETGDALVRAVGRVETH